MRQTLLILTLMLGACADTDEPVIRSRDITFQADGILEFVRPDGSVVRPVAMEIAETDSSRQRGLMDRRALSLKQSMLFIFPDEADRAFWMHSTPIPLDIIFVDADSQIVNIVKNTTPMSDERVRSTGPAQYVVEVRAGFSDRFGLTDSMRVRWKRRAELGL